MATLFRLGADLVIVLHGAFIAFVVLGGLLVLRWPRFAWIHVPAAIWGVLIELTGRICPLTPVENYLRERGGLASYPGDFIAHYLVSLIYPTRLTREHQIWLGTAASVVNVLIYVYVFLRTSGKPEPPSDAPLGASRPWSRTTTEK